MLYHIFMASKGCYSDCMKHYVVNLKIATLIAENYSPIAFINGATDKYNGDYFFEEFANSGSRFGRYVLLNAGYKETAEGKKAFCDKLKEVREKMQNPEQTKDTEETKNTEDTKNTDIKEDKNPDTEKVKLSIDLSQNVVSNVDSSKTNVPKPVAPEVKETNPLIEKIVIDELSEKVGGTEVSARVDEPNSPVTSKAKE